MLTALPRIETTLQHGEEASDASELEGVSPTSCGTADTYAEFYTGRQGQHVSRLNTRQRPAAIRWVARKLLQLQGKQQPPSGGYLPSGSSYESLSGFSDASVTSQQPKQQQQQQQFEVAAAHDAPVAFRQLEHTTEPLCSSNVAPATIPEEGRLRSIVRAVLRPVVRFMHHICSSAGPQGAGSNDNSLAEQVINVITSIPFFAIGLHGLRRRRCPRGRHFSLSFMAVGVVAAAYHGASPNSPVRPLFRKMDYYTICYTSNMLRRAAHIPLSRPLQLAALLVAPLKPTAVTGLNLALVEGKYLAHALQHTHLRPSFQLHLSTALVGMGCFWYEDVANSMAWPPVLHSLWHCLSALAMGCTNALLQHLELALLLPGVQMEAA